VATFEVDNVLAVVPSFCWRKEPFWRDEQVPPPHGQKKGFCILAAMGVALLRARLT
jgi:hypothetical protein